MVAKIRKLMPKKKEKGDIERNKLQNYIVKKPKHNSQKREKNQYQFQGFYERLKSLDVKQSHTLQMSHILDTIVDDQNLSSEFTKIQDQEQDLTLSTFIAFLRYEKMSNRTLDFKQIFENIEPLAYSHALIVLNQEQIVKVLLKYLKLKNSQNLNPTVLASNSRTQCISLDLFICLIKDLRSDIYEQFLQKILPASISVIDTQNITLLDKIFTLISFALKYLIKNIKADIKRFFNIYVELVQHKNRHLRKFACQGLSYVLRKFMADEGHLKQAIQVINFSIDQNENEVSVDLLHGISDVYFEMMYGASEDLY